MPRKVTPALTQLVKALRRLFLRLDELTGEEIEAFLAIAEMEIEEQRVSPAESSADEDEPDQPEGV